MVRCPLCESLRITIALGRESRAACRTCGARWIQDGASQRMVSRPAHTGGAEAPTTPVVVHEGTVG